MKKKEVLDFKDLLIAILISIIVTLTITPIFNFIYEYNNPREGSIVLLLGDGLFLEDDSFEVNNYAGCLGRVISDKSQNNVETKVEVILGSCSKLTPFMATKVNVWNRNLIVLRK